MMSCVQKRMNIEKECGNYKDHSLFGAKEWAKEILEKGMSCDPFERKIV